MTKEICTFIDNLAAAAAAAFPSFYHKKEKQVTPVTCQFNRGILDVRAFSDGIECVIHVHSETKSLLGGNEPSVSCRQFLQQAKPP
jgi:hypothetical protein